MLHLLVLVLCFITANHGQLTPDGCRFQTGKCAYEIKLSQEETCKDSTTENRVKEIESKLKKLESNGNGQDMLVKELEYRLANLTFQNQITQTNFGSMSKEKTDLEKKLQTGLDERNKMDVRLKLLETLVHDMRDIMKNSSSDCSGNTWVLQQRLETSKLEYEQKLSDLQLKLSQVEQELGNAKLDSQATSTRLEKCKGSLNSTEDCYKNLTTVKGKLAEQLDMNKKITDQLNNKGLPVLQVAKSCKEWKTLGYTTSGRYVVDPDGFGKGVGPLEVDCLMDDGGLTRTTIHHHNEDETAVSSCDSPLCYKIKIQYDALPEQIGAVIDNAATCTQFLKYACFASNLFWSYGSNYQYAAWYSRQNEKMKYWGGGHSNYEGCACGMTGTCDVSTNRCNCDSNDHQWREDSGFLNDKASLPVTMLAFGDALLEFKEQGYFTLGPVVCHD